MAGTAESVKFDPPVKMVVTFSNELEYTIEGVVRVDRAGEYLAVTHETGAMTFIDRRHYLIQVEGSP
jgi:demethoxyubiquinone hydroxylase (CLK1/Coq7/Cat5 family)